MNLPTLLLASIQKESNGLTGYDLTKQIKEKWNAFWDASHQQVYRELKKLLEDNYIDEKLEPQNGKPDRIRYSLSERGKAYLEEAQSSEAVIKTIRDNISVQLLAAPTDLLKLQLLDSYLDKQSVRLNYLRASHELSSVPFQQLIIDKQIKETSAQIEWAHEVQAILGKEST